MSIERNYRLLQRYRKIALSGGSLVIGTASAIGAWPYFLSVTTKYLVIVGGGAAVGALIGYLFFEFVIAHFIGPMPGGSSLGSSDTGAGGGGGLGGALDIGSSGEGGDGGGGD
jgi:hypothetical protein